MNHENGQMKDECPDDVPNTCAHHAIISGIIIENNFSSVVGEYNKLFETKYEKIYIWTHTKNKNIALISDIDLSVKNTTIWKTAGSLIVLAYDFNKKFEQTFEFSTDYKIMYNFTPTSSLDKVKFYNNDDVELLELNGFYLHLNEIASFACLIELLNRDDRCYTAVTLLISSLQLHYCCLICELGLSPYHEHEAFEPEIWEQTNFITNMESAVVQATRCIESILGEPPSENNRSRIITHKEKWKKISGINADDKYSRFGKSYWDYYLYLFDEIRNPSAHSYGKIHFDLERKQTIDAQCFAALVLEGYINQNKKDKEEAMNELKFNRKILERIPPKKRNIKTLTIYND